jgi:hypothetical protein
MRKPRQESFGLLIELLVEIKCRWCCAQFYICRSCFRGQGYCSDNCRINGRQKNRREAQQRYSKSDKGRTTRNYYKQSQPLTTKKEFLKKNMTLGADTSSTPVFSCDIVNPEQEKLIPKCRNCGRIGRVVAEFPRRLYGDDRRQPLIGHVYTLNEWE